MLLFNPLSIGKALERNHIEDYWVDTGTAIGQTISLKLMNNAGRNAIIVKHLWRVSEMFRGDFDRLITQESIELEVDEQTNFKTCCLLNFIETNFVSWSATRLDTISDDGLWGLLYYTGYLAVDKFEGPSLVCACSNPSISAHREIVQLYLPNSQRRSNF